MRNALIATLVLAVALAVATTASGRLAASKRDGRHPRLRQGQPQPGRQSATLTVGSDNPAFPPWFVGPEKKPWKVSDPTNGKGFESAVAYAVAKQLGFAKSEVAWTYVPFNNSYKPGKKSFDFYIQEVSYSPERAKAVDFSKAYYFVNQSVVGRKGKPIASVRSINGLKKYKLGRPDRDDELRLHRQQDQAGLEAARLRHERRGRAGAEDGPDRRARRRPPDRLLRHRGAGSGRQGGRPVRLGRLEGALRARPAEGQLADGVRRTRRSTGSGRTARSRTSSASGSPRRPARPS